MMENYKKRLKYLRKKMTKNTTEDKKSLKNLQNIKKLRTTLKLL